MGGTVKKTTLYQYCLWLSFGKPQFVCREGHNILFSLSRFECFVFSWLNFLFLFLICLSQSICSTTNPLHKELTEHVSSPTKWGNTSNNKTFKISPFKLKYIVIVPSLLSHLDKVSVEKLSTVYSYKWKSKEQKMRTLCSLAFNLW